MLLYGTILIILKFSDGFVEANHLRVTREADSENCTNPSGQTGICTNIINCHELYKLLTTGSKDPSVASFLRGSLCGRESKHPKVCCPSEDFSKCGKSTKKVTIIVGGKNAILGDWPWMVALGYVSDKKTDLEFKCGASLISNNCVVTAAHCVTNVGAFTLTTARLGVVNLNDTGDDKGTGIDVSVEEIIVHPDYSSNPVVNDIALIRLKQPVTFTKSIRPICILNDIEHKSDAFYARKVPYMIGWGAMERRGTATDILQDVPVQIVDNAECAKNYETRRSSVIDQRVLCAGRHRRGACLGDLGGPLILPIQNTYYLAGVLSYGDECADFNHPSVYTRVAQFSEWILLNTKT